MAKTRRVFSPEERVKLVTSVQAAVAGGASKKDAFKNAGIVGSIYNKWIGNRGRWLATATPEANGEKKVKRAYNYNMDRAIAAARKGARTRRLNKRRALRAAAGPKAVERPAEHELVHLTFPLAGNGAAQLNDADLLQLTPLARKRLALEGLRFIKILLE